MAFRQAKAAKIGGKFLSYGESGSGKSTFMDFPVKPVRHFPQSFVFADSSQGSGSGIDWNLILPAEYPQSLNMVGMFMGDQNSVQFLTFDFQRTKSLFNLFSADSRIH